MSHVGDHDEDLVIGETRSAKVELNSVAEM